jgi:hypothetical protein
MEQPQNDILTKALAEATPKARSVVEMVQEILGDGSKTLSVSFRRPVEDPVRADTPRRSHKFESIGSLCAYLSRYAQTTSLALLDAATGQACVVLEESQTNGVEVVTLSPRMHPLLAPWENLVGSLVGTQQFMRIVSDNRRSLVKPAAAEMMAVLRQIRITKSTTMELGVGADCINGVTVKTTIQGNAKDCLVSLPETMTIKVPLWVQGYAREVALDLFVMETGDPKDPIGVRVSSSDLSVQKIAEIESWSAMIKDAMPEGSVTGFGAVLHREWDLVK